MIKRDILPKILARISLTEINALEILNTRRAIGTTKFPISKNLERYCDAILELCFKSLILNIFSQTTSLTRPNQI